MVSLHLMLPLQVGCVGQVRLVITYPPWGPGLSPMKSLHRPWMGKSGFRSSHVGLACAGLSRHPRSMGQSRLH